MAYLHLSLALTIEQSRRDGVCENLALGNAQGLVIDVVKARQSQQ